MKIVFVDAQGQVVARRDEFAAPPSAGSVVDLSGTRYVVEGRPVAIPVAASGVAVGVVREDDFLARRRVVAE